MSGSVHIGPAWGAAKHVPDVRDWLLGTWADSGPFETASRLYRRAMGGPTATRSEAAWSRQYLKDASLFYLSADAVDQLVALYQSWPPDGTISAEDAPSRSGFVVLGKPIYGRDSQALDVDVRVDALLWGDVALGDGTELGVGIASYCAVELDDCSDEEWERNRGLLRIYLGDRDAERDQLSGVFLAHLGRSDWLWDTAPDAEITGMKIVDIQSVAEDRMLIASLWKLLSYQAFPASVVQPDRTTRRRSERRAPATPP